jgi:hypothetical protein
MSEAMTLSFSVAIMITEKNFSTGINSGNCWNGHLAEKILGGM